MKNKNKKIENWEGKIYDFLSPINLTMFREERTEKVILFIKELLKSEIEKDCQKFIKILEELNEFVETESGKSGRKEILQKIQEVINQLKDDEKI